MRKDPSVIFLNLLIHVVSIHNGHCNKEECNNAKGRQEIKLAFNEADHGNTASLIETPKVLRLLFNIDSYIRLPDRSDLFLRAFQLVDFVRCRYVLVCTSKALEKVTMEKGHYLVTVFLEDQMKFLRPVFQK